MFKGKEISPLATIKNIKRILNTCGIKVKETWFDSGLNNVFSVRLEVEGTEYGTNGKGSSKEFALASAYGELLERLGNGVMFKNGERQLTNSRFTYFPDEYSLSAECFENEINNTVFYHAIRELGNNFPVAYNRWRSLIVSKKVTCIKYKSEIDNSYQNVPVNILKVYGSNGMSAGNTADEAFVQAISEIFERFSLNTIISKKLCPPIIPLEYIKKTHKSIYYSVCEICQHPDLSIEFRDCSLNLNFPIICACIFNKKLHTDSISFGAHPSIEIAMERALNEALQGRNLSRITNAVYLRKRDSRYNRYSILKNGTGYYPYAFYSKKPSYPFVERKPLSFSDNAKMKQYIIDLCKKKGIEVYSHNITVYGFFVTHIIIPKMSEIMKYDDFQAKLDEMIKYVSCLPDFKSLDTIGYQTCLEFIDYTRKNPELWTNLANSITKNIKYTDMILLKTLFQGFFHLGYYDRAEEYNRRLKQYISFDCQSGLSIVVDMKKRGHSNEEIMSFLSYYYEKEAIEEILSFINNTFQNPFFKDKKAKTEISNKWIKSVELIKEGIVTE